MSYELFRIICNKNSEIYGKAIFFNKLSGVSSVTRNFPAVDIKEDIICHGTCTIKDPLNFEKVKNNLMSNKGFCCNSRQQN